MITLYVSRLGSARSIKQDNAYYGAYPTQASARAAAEAWAEELRKDGEEVTVTVTDLRPGGRGKRGLRPS